MVYETSSTQSVELIVAGEDKKAGHAMEMHLKRALAATLDAFWDS